MSRVDQVLEGSASASGVESFGLELRHAADGARHQMSFFLFTQEGSYGYRAEGALTKKNKTDWGGWAYTYEGTYQLSSRPGGVETMPASGTYVIDVVVSWRQRAVISTTVSLTEA